MSLNILALYVRISEAGWPLRRSARVSRVSSRVAALIGAHGGIAPLGGGLLPLTLQDEVNGRDVILGLDGAVGDMVDRDNELGHGGHSLYERDDWLHLMCMQEGCQCLTLPLAAAADGGPRWLYGPAGGRVDRENDVRRRDDFLTPSGPWQEHRR